MNFKQKVEIRNESPKLICSLFIRKVNFMANRFITVVMLEGPSLIILTQELRAKLLDRRS